MPTSPMEVTDAASRDAAQTSLRCTLQVWDLPEAVPPGEHFEFTVGVKAADGRCLAGWWVGLFQGNSGIGDRSDTDAPPIRQAPLQALPWPGSEALYWAKLQACSPSLTAAADDSQLASASPQAAVTQGWAVRLLPMPHPARSDLSGAALDLSTAVCEFSLPQSPATQHVLTLQVIDESENFRQEQDISVKETLSKLRDVDFAEALARLNAQMTALQVAQQAYSRISSRTLFDYL